MMRHIIYSICILMLLGLSSCFETYDEGYDLVGRVATIPVFNLSQSTATPGTSITATYRYYSEHEAVTGLRLLQLVEGQSSELETRSVSGHNLRDSYEGTFSYMVPDLADSTVVTLRLEVITENDLSNSRQTNLLVRTPEE
jgi:hypothetical protein